MPTAPRVFVLAAAGVAVLHTLLVNSFVPFSEVFGGKPIQGFDYDLHIGQVFRVVESLAAHGKSWSYDVQLLAGQPEGTITDAGSKGWELWTYALYSLGVPRETAFNTFVLAVMLSAPVWLFLAARGFGLTRATSLLAAGMVSTLWFFDSHLHWIWFVGMISWAGASCLALYTISAFYRYANAPSVPRWIPASLGLSGSLLIHPYTFLVLAPPLLIMTGRAWRAASRTALVGVAAMALTAIAANAFWLHNAARHWHYILDSAFFAQASPIHFACDFFDVLCSGDDTGVIGTRTGFRFMYLALAIGGLAIWRRQRDDRFLPLAITLVSLYFFAYLGTFIPGLQQTQPYRQVTPAMLLTCLPAAVFVTVAQLARLFTPESRIPRALSITIAVVAVKFLVATQIMYFFPELIPSPPHLIDGTRSPLTGYGFARHPNPQLAAHARYDLPHRSSPYDTGIEDCLEWFQANASEGDRILVQPAVLGERMAWRGRFEVLGGFFERNVMHVDSNLFRRFRRRNVTPERLEEYLRVFAVQWIVGNRQEFPRSPELLEPVKGAGPYRIYRTLVPVNRVLAGGGTVSAKQNRIQVTGSDPNAALLLSYHWHEALRCKPDCRIQREELSLDRVGLIRVPAPHPADLTIWNSYQQ